MMSKAQLRQQHLQRRKALAFKTVSQKSESITHILLRQSFVKTCRLLYGYMSFNNEADVFLLKEYLDEVGGVFCTPKVIGDGLMSFRKIDGFQDLQVGTYGIMEPKDSCSVHIPKSGDIVLVPGACFDMNGYRIGYGGGFYDRLMEAHPEATYIGVAFEDQIVEEIAVEAHDMQLDMLVTEERLIKFS